MTIEPGQQLLHFRLVEKIGEGGMGVVWKAVDTTLDREVAIKVLPELFSSDAERLARFEREAKLLASLNHPNIATIHGLHQAEGKNFLAMELVEGEDLAQRLSRGPVPVDEVMRLAVQIATALEAAHENGVIHRDLKPANVKTNVEGVVKVLDFGLAKALAPGESSEDSSASMSPTVTSAGTIAGVILGTAAYMSPEQAKGVAVDRRADIWGFGVMLFEMLTGKRLFRGETVSETLAAVMMKDVDLEALPAETPSRVRRLLRRCLQRDPRSRLRDIGDARLAIEEVMAGETDEPVAAAGAAAAGARPSGAKKALLLVGALVLLVIGLAVGWWLRPAPAEPTLRKFMLDVAGITEARISPDGTRVAYVADRKLFIRELDRFEPQEIAGTEGLQAVFWSPDGTSVGYGSGGKLWKTAVTGGPPTQLCDLPEGWGRASGGAWQPDGTIVFTSGNTGLNKVSAQGGDAVVILEPEADKESDFHNASPLPDGRGVLFVIHRLGHGTGVDTIALWADGEKKVLIHHEGQSVWDPVYSPTGHVLYRREPTNPGIWALPFSLAKLEVTGEPFLVVSGSNHPSVSADGTLVYVPGAVRRLTRLVWTDREGNVLEPISEARFVRPYPALSPDGKRVALAEQEGVEWDLWVYDVERSTRTRLTFNGGVREPTWSPDSRRIAFYTGNTGSDYEMFECSADGTGQLRSLGRGERPAYSPDGTHLVYSAFGEGKGEPDLWYRPLEADASQGVLLQRSNQMDTYPRVAPGGDYVAYQSPQSGRVEVFIGRYPEGEGKWQVSVDGGKWPKWSADGRRLYYASGDDILEVDVSPGPPLVLGTPRTLFTRGPLGYTMRFGWEAGFDVTADGERFVVPEGVDVGGDGQFAVVESWIREFAP